MNKYIFLFALAVITVLSFTSCSKDDDEKFNYPMETLYGTWEGTEIKVGSTTIDLTDFWTPSKYQFSTTFKSDGTYYGRGYFGTGEGTYKATGDMIYTYVDGQEYARYKVISLEYKEATLLMTTPGGSTAQIKVRKKI